MVAAAPFIGPAHSPGAEVVVSWIRPMSGR